MCRAHRSTHAGESEKGRRLVNMTSIKRLLLATDFSEWARGAEVYACALAASWRAQLTVMTVVEFPPGMDPENSVHRPYVADRMRDASARLSEFEKVTRMRGIASITRISTGVASDELIAAATAGEAELIIVGTRGQSDLAHVVLGSTAERIIRLAPCPVLAIHTMKGQEQTGIAIERILVPTDFSDCSLEAVDYAAVLAGQAKASIELLHVLEPSYYSPDLTIEPPAEREARCKEAKDRLHTLSEKLGRAGIRVKQTLRGGVPVDTILDEAQCSSSDLIVMGTHGRGRASDLWTGSVAEAVLRRGEHPVLTVRNPAF